MIVMIGMQVRMVSAYVLNQDATRFLEERTDAPVSEGAVVSIANDSDALPNKVIHPPEWLGWFLVSVGAVLMLHSLAMPKPG
ncbi:MAG: hypothetical protein MK171_10565 [Pirellulales bacterium]|nr:hypothetical protein [Pirellulales bacterium]